MSFSPGPFSKISKNILGVFTFFWLKNNAPCEYLEKLRGPESSFADTLFPNIQKHVWGAFLAFWFCILRPQWNMALTKVPVIGWVFSDQKPNIPKPCFGLLFCWLKKKQRWQYIFDKVTREKVIFPEPSLNMSKNVWCFF